MALYEELKAFNYENNDVAIRVFESAEQIRQTGKTLHNCIGTYIEKYANKSTRIFYGMVGDSLEFAVEVKNGKLVQVRGDYNQAPGTDIRNVVAKWCKLNNIRE